MNANESVDSLKNDNSTDSGGFLSTLKKRVTAKRLALIAVFVALSYAVSFIEIPAPFFGASFLKLDFGNVFILLISFLLGPIEGVTVCLLKESLRLIGGTGAGELANFLVTSAFILLPSIAYQKNKTFKTVIITLIISIFIATGVSLLVNRVIVFPAFALVGGGTIFGMTVTEAFSKFWLGVLAFNFIKTLSISLLTLLLYKRLSNVLKKWKF